MTNQQVPVITEERRQQLIAECKAEISDIRKAIDEARNNRGGASILHRLCILVELQEISLAALEAPAWGYTSGIRHPVVNGAVVRDVKGVNQFAVYTAPPVPVMNAIVLPEMIKCTHYSDGTFRYDGKEEFFRASEVISTLKSLGYQVKE